MAEALLELVSFLGPEVRPDVQDLALQNVLSVSSDDAGRRLFLEAPGMVGKLLEVLVRWQTPTLARDAALALINLSATPVLAEHLMQQGTLEALVEATLAADSPVADPALMALCNLTRSAEAANTAWDRLENRLPTLLATLSRLDHNTKGQHLHYLGPLIANLTQVSAARLKLLKSALPTLAPFTRFEASGVRRGGIVSALRNLCFDETALESEKELLPPILLPLAAADPLTDEEMEKLPMDLQYLPTEHTREVDPDLRRLLIEALALLSASSKGREILRDNGVYYILRELHKWEEDREVLLTCQNLVELLIRTEEEIGAEDLRKVEVPQHLVNSFESMDKEFLEMK